jgi:hypothetical protein
MENRMESQSEVKASFKLLIIASIVTIVLWFIPFADVVTYPFRIFGTFIHETGHALASLATFGSVNRFEINWNGSGLTESSGWGFFISSAGYLSTTIYGAVLLLLLRRQRNARGVAMGTGILLLVITLMFGSNLLAWLAGILFGAGCIWLAIKGKPKFIHFFMSFLAVQTMLNAFYDLYTLAYISTFAPGQPTDAGNMERITGVPATFWAVTWSLISLVILVLTLVIYYRSLKQRAALTASPAAALIEDPSHFALDREG